MRIAMWIVLLCHFSVGSFFESKLPPAFASRESRKRHEHFIGPRKKTSLRARKTLDLVHLFQNDEISQDVSV